MLFALADILLRPRQASLLPTALTLRTFLGKRVTCPSPFALWTLAITYPKWSDNSWIRTLGPSFFYTFFWLGPIKQSKVKQRSKSNAKACYGGELWTGLHKSTCTVQDRDRNVSLALTRKSDFYHLYPYHKLQNKVRGLVQSRQFILTLRQVLTHAFINRFYFCTQVEKKVE